jgi:hypothetical protein
VHLLLLRSTKTHVIRVLRWAGYHQFVWGLFGVFMIITLWRITRLSNRSEHKVNVANCTVENWESPLTDLTERIPKGKTLEPPVCRHLCFFHPSLFFSWLMNRSGAQHGRPASGSRVLSNKLGCIPKKLMWAVLGAAQRSVRASFSTDSCRRHVCIGSVRPYHCPPHRKHLVANRPTPPFV